MNKELEANTNLSHYRIVSKIGAGGMGEVYLAQDTTLDRKVALKILRADMAANQDRMRRFVQEAKAAAALSHPNIAQVFEIGQHDGTHFIAMEFIEGATLREKIYLERIDLRRLLRFLQHAAEGLAKAHAAGIVHRDLKPDNVMITRDGHAKILDFGLAKLIEPTGPDREGGLSEVDTAVMPQHSTPGVVMGTVGYMSPEQAQGKTNEIDQRSDIFSFGCILYEAVTGQKAFAGKDLVDSLNKIIREPVAPISDFRPDTPSHLQRIVWRCLAKDPEDRYQTIKDVAIELRDLRRELERVSIDTTVPPVRSDTTAGPGEKIKTVETDRAQTGSSTPRSFWSSPSFTGVFRHAQAQKVPFSIFALALFALVSAAAYLIFVTPGSNRRIDSIAVLPFENLSGNSDLDYVCDGLSESLIDRLSQLPQLRVISRNSSFKFRGANIDVRDVASQLGVRAIVTGSVAQLGDDLTIRVDIVDAAENRHLTGGQYRRKAGDLLSIQNEIAQTASEQLRLKLTDSQSKRLAENGTENSEAYRYYLSGLVELSGPQDVRSRALEYFERAVTLDPDFAAAHAEIAWVYWSQANGSRNPHELMPKAKAATERALAIDPDLAKAHVVQAMVNEYEFDWRGAEREYRRAIELSPNLDFAHNNYAFFLSVMGRQDDALAELEQQNIRDPINRRLALLQKGIVLTQARRFDDALQAYQEAQAVEPAKDVPNFSLGYAYAGKGLYNEAAGYYRKSVDLLGGEEKYSQPLVYLAATYAKMPEKRSEARAILTRIEAMDQYTSPALLAAVYSALDDNDKAMELLELGYIKRDLLLRFIGTGYEYDGLRGDQRFVDLTRRIGLGQ